MNLVLATKNKGKTKQFKEIFQKESINIFDLNDIGFNIVIEEDENTLEGNAIKKAKVVCKKLHKPVISDDSGLSVHALNGRPGVFSARYAGKDASYEENIAKLLKDLKDVPNEKRHARFVCVMALAIPFEDIKIVKGSCDGFIIDTKRGTGGFGYAPIFYFPAIKKTMAELSYDEWFLYSHRAKACRKMLELLKENKEKIEMF